MLFPLNGRRQVGAVAALIAGTLPLTATQAAQAAPSAQARLASAAKKTPNRNVTAIVQFKAKVNERQARAIVRAHRGRVTDRLPVVKGLAVKLPAREASALRQDKQVRNVTLNSRVHNTKAFGDWLGTTFPQTVGADKAWDRGITGKGVGVAVIDSGINGDMPDFKNADGTSRVTNVIANPGATRPGDEVGHGTHVAGIIAGNSAPGSKKSVYLGHCARGRPDRGQDRRRRRQLDRP